MRKERNIVTEDYDKIFKRNCYATVEYFINTKKKIIVCKISPYIVFWNNENPTEEFFDYCDERGIFFTGKATCMEEDEFDIELGKKIAYDKAETKLLLAKKKYCADLIVDLSDEIVKLKECIDQTTDQIEKVKTRFNKKIEEMKK